VHVYQFECELCQIAFTPPAPFLADGGEG
jgi:hypothetical protein